MEIVVEMVEMVDLDQIVVLIHLESEEVAVAVAVAVVVLLVVKEAQDLLEVKETQELQELLETSLQVAQEDQQLQALNFQFQLLHRQLIQLQLLLEVS